MTTMQLVQVLSSSHVDGPLLSCNTNQQQQHNSSSTIFDNDATSSATCSTLFKEQHPLRMINDHEEDEEDDRNVHQDNDVTTTQMHLTTNMEHLKLRDNFLSNIIDEDSSITFHNIMSNPNKTIKLTDDTIGSSITICDGSSSSSSTSKTTTTTTTTASTTTGTTTKMRGSTTRNLQGNKKHLPKNMDSMPYPIVPVPSIVMSKSESYDALFSSSSSSSASATASVTAGGEITAEGGITTSTSTSKDDTLPVSGHPLLTEDDESEWYPDSPTTVATDVQGLSPSNGGNTVKNSSTLKCMPEMLSKEKMDKNTTSASTCVQPERSDFLNSQRQIEKKTNFKECFKLFFKGKKGELISPLNDLSIYGNDSEESVTMVVEISKGTKAKMFVDTLQAYHPIVQDVSIDTGKLSYLESPFHWNMGFIPQTLTSSAGCASSSRSQQQRPLSAIEISSGCKLPLGSVTKVKVLGALGILHLEEYQEVVDWKILCIHNNDSSFDKYNDVNDVPNYIQCGIREWFRWNNLSTSEDEMIVQFANDENYQSKFFAIQLIQNAHITWKNNASTFLN